MSDKLQFVVCLNQRQTEVYRTSLTRLNHPISLVEVGENRGINAGQQTVALLCLPLQRNDFVKCFVELLRGRRAGIRHFDEALL